MSVLTQRKRFLALSDQIRDGKVPLTNEQINYLADAFEKIGLGCNADFALGLSYSAGKSKSKDKALEERRFVLHWMTCAMQSEEEGGYALNIDEAIQAVIQLADGDWTIPRTNERLICKDANGNKRGIFKKYSDDYLRNMWYDSKNKPFKTVHVAALDMGSPYEYKKYEEKTDVNQQGSSNPHL